MKIAYALINITLGLGAGALVHYQLWPALAAGLVTLVLCDSDRHYFK